MAGWPRMIAFPVDSRGHRHQVEPANPMEDLALPHYFRER
jgi:hypothetical protein